MLRLLRPPPFATDIRLKHFRLANSRFIANGPDFTGLTATRRYPSMKLPMPKLSAGEVLIRVHATAVTQGEFEWYPTWHTPKGDPRIHPVPSHEFSGAIEEIAPDVKGLEKGDVVYGLNNWFIDGAAAEYCITTPAEIAPKPAAIR